MSTRCICQSKTEIDIDGKSWLTPSHQQILQALGIDNVPSLGRDINSEEYDFKSDGKLLQNPIPFISSKDESINKKIRELRHSTIACVYFLTDRLEEKEENEYRIYIKHVALLFGSIESCIKAMATHGVNSRCSGYLESLRELIAGFDRVYLHLPDSSIEERGIPEEVRRFIAENDVPAIESDRDSARRERDTKAIEPVMKELKESRKTLDKVARCVEGVPILVDESRNETEKAIRLSDSVIKNMGFSDEERTVFFGNRGNKTQSCIAQELKCKKDHVIYVTKKINVKLMNSGRPKMIWNNASIRRDNIIPIDEYSIEDMEQE